MERHGFRLWTIRWPIGARKPAFSPTQPPDTVAVPCISLPTLLAPLPYVDFIHCDIQGAENEVLPPALDVLDGKVGRVIVGTHSTEIHESLRDSFRSHGWLLEFEHLHTAVADGTQVWLNPRPRAPNWQDHLRSFVRSRLGGGKLPR